MTHALYIDPIEHAWRHCNPRAPLPPILIQRAAPPAFTLSLYSSQGQLVAEWSGTQDTRLGLLTVAILPQISPPNKEVGEGRIE